MKIKQLFTFLGSVLIYIHLFFLATAQDNNPPATLFIENEFIKIIVNNKDAIGRFAIETTQGDPNNALDNNQSLIYGRPIPWTSYTTIFIDGVPYIFGNPDKRLKQRSRQVLNYGTVKFQRISNESIVTLCEIDGLYIYQTLTFFRNPNTNVKDSALIRYDIANNQAEKEVGFRIMLDTMLGSNDGAPFRMGKDVITSEILYQRKNLYDYWLTFDSLTSPNIVAQGLLQTSSETLTFPNKIQLANWGTLVDHPWDINYVEDRSFIRTGEKEKDTALALFFDPVKISTNKEYTIQTVYGLGGLSLTPGELSVGLTMPKESAIGTDDRLLISGFILNAGGYDSHQTTTTFTLPKGFNVIQGQTITSLNILRVGEQQQIPIIAQISKSAVPGKVPVTFTVHSSTFGKNTITRFINLTPPLQLKASIEEIAPVNISQSPYVEVVSKITNETQSTIKDITALLRLNPNLELPKTQTQLKHIQQLKPYETRKLNWTIRVNQFDHEFSEFFIDLTSKYTKNLSIKKTISIFNRAKTNIFVSRPILLIKEPFFIQIELLNFQENLSNTSFDIQFDPKYLNLIHTSISPILFNKDNYPTLENGPGYSKISNVSTNSIYSSMKMFTLYFEPLASGSTDIILIQQGAIQNTKKIVIAEPKNKDHYLDYNKNLKEKK